MITDFRKTLTDRQQKSGSLLCVGQDPKLSKMPPQIQVLFNEKMREYAQYDIPKEVKDILVSTVLGQVAGQWMSEIGRATAPYACLFKPQSAHWETIGGGRIGLQKTVQATHQDNMFLIPSFLDCKRGDIAATQACYREAHFTLDKVDGMNFNPYMGQGCMEQLFDPRFPGRAIVGLAYTSNPDAREVQDIDAGGEPLWVRMVELIMKWADRIENKHSVKLTSVGLVMAAAFEHPKGSGIVYTDHLKRCRDIVGDRFWFLIPGVGTQGGYVAETVKAAYVGMGSIAINSSSGISFRSTGEDYAEAAANEARKLRDQMSNALLEMG